MTQKRQAVKPPSWEPRQQALVLLKEHSEGKRISPATFGVQGRDRSWNAYADSFIHANRSALTSLEVDVGFASDRDEIGLVLRPSGVIGAVPLRAPTTQKVTGGVVVQPRFGWNGIGTLLAEIGWSASPELLRQPLVPGSAREVPPWVLAGPIIQQIAALLKELTRGFRLHEEVRQTPRGQIIWQEYCTRHMARGSFHQLPCRFPELGPDQLLRAHLRWGLERIRASLASYVAADMIARHLHDTADALLQDLRDVPAKAPTHRTLDRLSSSAGITSAVLQAGLQALGWIVDERGLAGLSETDGLSWRLLMHELFERWVEHIVRLWARQFGGIVTTARTGDAAFPILWERQGSGSLSNLAPDIVVQAGDTVFICDAKYKGHFEELDDRRWRDLEVKLQGEHRHDMHQVLAYASLFDAPRVVSILVYPVYSGTWESLSQRHRTIVRGQLPASSRRSEVALVGIPVQPPAGKGAYDVARQWDELRQPLVD